MTGFRLGGIGRQVCVEETTLRFDLQIDREEFFMANAVESEPHVLPILPLINAHDERGVSLRGILPLFVSNARIDHPAANAGHLGLWFSELLGSALSLELRIDVRGYFGFFQFFPQIKKEPRFV